MTHGAAGQGYAALKIAAARPELGDICMAVVAANAKRLVQAQDEDGGWTVPQTLSPLSRQRVVGFAHGVAGIVAF